MKLLCRLGLHRWEDEEVLVVKLTHIRWAVDGRRCIRCREWHEGDSATTCMALSYSAGMAERGLTESIQFQGRQVWPEALTEQETSNKDA